MSANRHARDAGRLARTTLDGRAGAEGDLRRMTLAGVVALGALMSPAHAVMTEAHVDARVRYQLLSIAVEAGRACDWPGADFTARAVKRREALADSMVARDLSDPGDLAAIRKRARRVFRTEGCRSKAISDLVATVRASGFE